MPSFQENEEILVESVLKQWVRLYLVLIRLFHAVILGHHQIDGSLDEMA